MTLADRAAVVTGASRGIGAAVARVLAERGARLVLAARGLDGVEALRAALASRGAEAHATVCDVSDPASVRALGDFARERVGPVGVLVNNAGIASSAPIGKIDLEEWNRTFAVNATGPFLCMQAFVGDMVSRGWGRIVNVASVASRVGAPYIGAYTASKHALLGLTRTAAAELGEKGVTVNAVCPGYVDTDMAELAVRGVMERSKLPREQALAAVLKTVGQRRLITPQEVATLVAYLCGEGAGGINGQAIVVDGGGLLS